MTRVIDVFNGDADGVCALHQLRLAEPVASDLVTGVKRDIRLLDRVQAATGDRVTVLDISLDSNRASLLRLLEAGAQLTYFDHHHCGEIPGHVNLDVHIDLSSGACTSILVDRHLQGRFRLWAIVAAFGDNLEKSGRLLSLKQGLADADMERLALLGERLNYNGYGDTLDDLHFHPAELYAELRPYTSPFDFLAQSKVYRLLDEGLRNDLAAAEATTAMLLNERVAAYVLPDAPWARRVSGVLANHIATATPKRAHAVLTPNRHGDYTVSVRSPVASPAGADELCLRFETGGGRRAAAGINRLPPARLQDFLDAFSAQFQAH